MDLDEIKVLTHSEEKELSLRLFQEKNLYVSKNDSSFAFKFYTTGNGGEYNGWIRFDKDLINFFINHPNSFIILIVDKEHDDLRKVFLLNTKLGVLKGWIQKLNDLLSENNFSLKKSFSLRKLKGRNVLKNPRNNEQFNLDDFEVESLTEAFQGLNFNLKNKSANKSESKISENENTLASSRRGKVDILKKTAVEQSAVNITIDYYSKKGFSYKKVESEKIGWDVTFKKGIEELKVEVKGLSGKFINVEFTPNEYAVSNREKENGYIIAIVTEALSKAPTLHLFEYNFNFNNWKSKTGISLDIKLKIGAVLKAKVEK